MKSRRGKIGEGCWYCLMVDDNLTFSQEFDTPVHIECIRKRLEECPNDDEAMVFVREFDMIAQEDLCSICGISPVAGTQEMEDLCEDCQWDTFDEEGDE